MEGLDEVIKEFLVESHESLDQLDRDLLSLEDTPDDRERLASIFRTVHTIKGTAGFLALPKLERLAHVGENLLVPLRDGELELSHDMADSLLSMVDAIRAMLGHIESDGAEGDTDYAHLIERLEELRHATADSLIPTSTPPAVESLSTTGEIAASDDLAESIDAPGHVDDDDTHFELLDHVEHEEEIALHAEPSTTAPQNSGRRASQRSGASGSRNSSDSSDAGERSNSLVDSTVRIDVEILDKLMNLVGELVLSRNQIVQFSNSFQDAAMIAASQRLNLITTELQESVMKTRMQPIRNAWSKLPRVVRDLSASCGKRVEVRMKGAETELDKTILEAIKDPLTHIVRNCVDHGIESPETREANGKSPEGTLCLRAFHEGGQVNIEISDDGAGINLDRVRAKAVEKGVITAEQAAAMSDREATNLILLPGFSTAQKVTNVSGRGVGMDVVKTNIERIGGNLEINSAYGEGTTLRIKIPLTLAIVPALIVKTGGDQYAIPQVSLLELVRLDGTRAKDDIHFIHDAPVYRLRGNLLPLVYLDEQLELREPRLRQICDETINIVVLQAEDRQFGLVVDGITDTQEIVVKPLGRRLKGISTFAGSTIMGDGSVALILDVIGLAQKANVLTERRDQTLRGQSSDAAAERLSALQSLLVVDPGDGSRVAMPLSTVSRLEEFLTTDIERSGHFEVVQYRGHIMPLVRLGSGGMASYDQVEERLPVVVYGSDKKSVGIVVGRIVDIVQHDLSQDDGDAALPGRHVIQGRVTELIDLEQLVRSVCPSIFEHSAA